MTDLVYLLVSLPGLAFAWMLAFRPGWVDRPAYAPRHRKPVLLPRVVGVDRAGRHAHTPVMRPLFAPAVLPPVALYTYAGEPVAGPSILGLDPRDVDVSAAVDVPDFGRTEGIGGYLAGGVFARLREQSTRYAVLMGRAAA